MLKYEHRSEPLLPTRGFLVRLARHGGIALGIIMLFLGLGTWGYHVFVGLPWLDAMLNASMILGGMGPVDPIVTVGGKWFASIYALLSGLVFIVIVGVVLAPVFHRIFHRLNLDKG
jgi:hypothetical protein